MPESRWIPRSYRCKTEKVRDSLSVWMNDLLQQDVKYVVWEQDFLLDTGRIFYATEFGTYIKVLEYTGETTDSQEVRRACWHISERRRETWFFTGMYQSRQYCCWNWDIETDVFMKMQRMTWSFYLDSHVGRIATYGTCESDYAVR